MNHLVWLVPIIIIVAMLIGSSWRPSIRKILMTLGVVGAVILVVFLYRGCSSNDNKNGSKSQTSASTTRYVRRVVQLPDCFTPCEIKISQIRDLYTDGEAIYALPPGWPQDKAVLYSGHGHMVLSGGNIRSGTWKFWAADDPDKAVLIRAFALQ